MRQTTLTTRNGSNHVDTPASGRDRVSSSQSIPSATLRGRHGPPDNPVHRARLSWYGPLVVLMMLTIAAGWELWRLLLLALTLD